MQQEEIYFSVGIDSMINFRNVFTGSFLKYHRGQIQIFTKITKEPITGCDMFKYKTGKDLIVVYNCSHNTSLIFRFPGDGKVYIDKIIGADETTRVSTVTNCATGGNFVRQQVLHKIYRDLGVDIAELEDL